MDPQTRQTREAEIRGLTNNEQYTRAVELALELYGDELLGFLMGSIRDEAVVEDVFQNLNLELWRALPTFEWRSSLRTWLYVLARGVLGKHLRDPFRKRGVPLSTHDEANIPMRLARTATQSWRKTQVKEQLWSLTAQLPQADRELLVLRISRKMTWPEIAQILSDESDLDDTALRRAASTLRKRYERLKTQLREQMVDD